MAWIMAHWVDILIHLGLDTTGGLTMRCAMGMCDHKHHQYIVWFIVAIIVSITTVMLVG